MRILGYILAALIVLIQYPLWFGKGGWLRAWDLDRQVSAAQDKNAALERRNGALAAEVKDLKTGTEAIEERARYELGMTRADEVFYQYPDENRGQSPIKKQ
jgi:cell division protein FtsB